MNTDDLDTHFMQRAFDLAVETRDTGGNEAIGAVIVHRGKIVATGANEVKTRCDVTAHAEMVAIQAACKALGKTSLGGATLYSSLQPCGMCTMASIWGKIGRIVYGAGREDVHSMYFEDRHLGTMDFIADAYRDDMTITGGVLRERCAELYAAPDADIPLEEQANR